MLDQFILKHSVHAWGLLRWGSCWTEYYIAMDYSVQHFQYSHLFEARRNTLCLLYRVNYKMAMKSPYLYSFNYLSLWVFSFQCKHFHSALTSPSASALQNKIPPIADHLIIKLLFSWISTYFISLWKPLWRFWFANASHVCRQIYQNTEIIKATIHFKLF